MVNWEKFFNKCKKIGKKGIKGLIIFLFVYFVYGFMTYEGIPAEIAIGFALAIGITYLELRHTS